jgi:hypothetical protein
MALPPRCAVPWRRLIGFGIARLAARTTFNKSIKYQMITNEGT